MSDDTIPDLPQALLISSQAYGRNQTKWAFCFADSLTDRAANKHYDTPGVNPWEPHTVHIFITGRLPAGCRYTLDMDDNEEVYNIVPNGRFAGAGRDHYALFSHGIDLTEDGEIAAPQSEWRWDEKKNAMVPPAHPWEVAMFMFDVKPDGTLWSRMRVDVPRWFERTALYVGHEPNASKPVQQPYVTGQIARALKLTRIIKTSGDAAPGEYPLQARYVYADGSESVTDYTLTIKE